MIARFVKDLRNVAGDAKLFALDEPLDGATHLAVAVIDMPRWNQVETQILPSTEKGASWRGVDGSLSVSITLPPTDGVPPDHDSALASLGYAADYTPWPEPEPTTMEIVATAPVAVTDPQGNVLMLAEGDRAPLPIPVAEGLIAQGVATRANPQ